MGCRRGSAFRKSSLSIVASWDLKKTPDFFVSTYLFSVCVKFLGDDFTDFADYGYATDSFADAITAEDWMWSVVDYDDQDFSDTSDYYSFDD